MLSHLESTFSLLQYVDIEENSVPFNDLSFIIAKREIAIQKPTIGSIRPAATKLHLNRFSGVQFPTASLPTLGRRRQDQAHPPSPIPSPLLWSGRSTPTSSGSENQLFHRASRSPRRRAIRNEGPKLTLAAQDLLFCRLTLGDVGHRPDKLTIARSML